jgi:hypothetical protein
MKFQSFGVTICSNPPCLCMSTSTTYDDDPIVTPAYGLTLSRPHWYWLYRPWMYWCWLYSRRPGTWQMNTVCIQNPQSELELAPNWKSARSIWKNSCHSSHDAECVLHALRCMCMVKVQVSTHQEICDGAKGRLQPIGSRL